MQTLKGITVQSSQVRFCDVIDQSDVDNRNLIRASGGLKQYIEQNKAVAQLDESAGKITVHKIERIRLEDYLYVTPSSLKAMQIFDQEANPSRSLGAASKEGFSVLGCLQETISTRAGQRLLRQWCLKPTRQISILESRLEIVSLLKLPRFAEYITFLRKRLRKVKDLQNIFHHFRNATTGLSDWIGLHSSLVGMLKLTELVQLIVKNLDPSIEVPSLFVSLTSETSVQHAKNLVQVRRQ